MVYTQHNATVLLVGGVGDFLQCLPFLLQNKGRHDILVVTHQAHAKTLFESLGIKLKGFETFGDVQQLQHHLKSLSSSMAFIQCPRHKYFINPVFPVPTYPFSKTQPVVGLQFAGSSFSKNFLESRAMPSKAIPPQAFEGMKRSNYNYLLFGTPSELESPHFEEAENVRKISFPDIYTSLSYVSHCDVFIGSDSAFKTCSTMMRLPTLVWLGDYSDPVRDSTFIDPYTADGIMETFRYTNLNDAQQISDGVQQTLSFISKYCSGGS